MKQSKKLCILVATACVVAGLAIMAVGFVFTLLGFGARGQTGTQAELVTTPVKENFSSIEIQTLDSDIRFVPSDDGRCQVKYTDRASASCSVSVENGTLRIVEKDTTPWYQHITFSWWGDTVNYGITVCLPSDSYDRLTLEGASSDVTISKGFRFQEAELNTASGEISFTGTVLHNLQVKTVSGDQELSGVSCGALKVSTTSGRLRLSEIEAESLNLSSTSGDVTLTGGAIEGALQLGTVSGEIELRNVTADSAGLSSTSGDMDLENVALTDQLSIETTSGEIDLEDCDAGGCWIKTTSGDVEGTLLSPMQFVTHTTSGDVDTPACPGADRICEITTTSGDIQMEIARQNAGKTGTKPAA